MGVYINIDVKEIRRGAGAILNIDDVAFFVKGKDIIAVPDHGDLIDRDEQIERAWRLKLNTRGLIAEMLNTATVVIPADRSEEECEDENWYTELDDPKIAERNEDA